MLVWCMYLIYKSEDAIDKFITCLMKEIQNARLYESNKKYVDMKQRISKKKIDFYFVFYQNNNEFTSSFIIANF